MKRYEDKYAYDDYVAIQRHRAFKKWNMQQFDTVNHATVIARCLPYISEIQTVGCMGIRRGNEYVSFKELSDKHVFHYPLTVYGVDINDTVTAVGDNCVCADFTHLPSEWENKFDLLYSNSLDHAFDVAVTMTEWHRVVKPNGFLLLDLINNPRPDKSDVYAFALGDEKELFDLARFTLLDTWPESSGLRFNVLAQVKK